ncbi:MAG: DHH family phosphoesterase [Candidatus Diapherotrites archaeon]|uniref:DHH family phosphoesterase n=1 Tax=Candidatus Iainarchaeum sp. TaxID=3101447 RepID=A0A8T4KXW5_9ARCH|nr:DHH family phosphoesterase [Candidatus Diapherotrites archaeon]
MPLKVLAEFDRFVNSLSEKDRIAIITDHDTDGVTAGVIAFKALLQITGKMPAMVIIASNQNEPLSEKTVRVLKKKKINKLVCPDISLDQKERLFFARKISKFAKILNIDHHKVYAKSIGKGNVLVKPQFFSKIDPSRYASAKMCFDLFSRHTNLEGSEWIAALGLYGDWGEKAWKGFFSSALRKAGISLEKIKELHGILAAVDVLEKKRLPECFNNLLSVEKPANSLRSFAKYRQRLESMLREAEMDFWKNAECHPKLEYCFYLASAKYGIAANLINRLAKKAQKTTLVIGQRAGKEIKLSARRSDRKIAVNELLENAVKGLKEGSAGGHEPAAGGKILAKDLGKFKKKVLEILEKKRKK